MTRYHETVELLTKTYEPDAEGVPQETVKRFKAYCNSYTVATQAWSTAKMANYEADDEIQLRTCDYHGETDVVYRGKAYSVFQRMEQGDFTRLLIQRQKSDKGYDDVR